MKTITLKADDRFDATLTSLAKKLNTTKSSVIRASVMHYKRQLEHEVLKQRVRDASMKTRKQALQIAAETNAAGADGL